LQDRRCPDFSRRAQLGLSSLEIPSLPEASGTAQWLFLYLPHILPRSRVLGALPRRVPVYLRRKFALTLTDYNSPSRPLHIVGYPQLNNNVLSLGQRHKHPASTLRHTQFPSFEFCALDGLSFYSYVWPVPELKSRVGNLQITRLRTSPYVGNARFSSGDDLEYERLPESDFCSSTRTFHGLRDFSSD